MGWIIRVAAAVALGVAGFAVGWGVAVITDADAEVAVVASPDAARVFDCPNGNVVGAFERQSRVYVVARSEPSGWYLIRDLDQAGDRVWISAADLSLDADTGAVAVDSCAARVGIAAGAGEDPVESTTSTTVVEGSTTTTVVVTTTTTEPPGTTTTSTSTTSTTAPPVTTTTKPDTTPPTIGNASAVPAEITRELAA